MHVLLHNSIYYSINTSITTPQGGKVQEKITLHSKQMGSLSGDANLSYG